MQENAYLFPFEYTTLDKNLEQSSTTQAQSKLKSHNIFNVSFWGNLSPSTGWVTWASRSSPTTLSLSFEKSLTAWLTYKQVIAVRVIKPFQNIRRRFSVHITSGKEHKPLGTRFSKREHEPANLPMTHHITCCHGIQTSKREVQSWTVYMHLLVHE